MNLWRFHILKVILIIKPSKKYFSVNFEYRNNLFRTCQTSVSWKSSTIERVYRVNPWLSSLSKSSPFFGLTYTFIGPTTFELNTKLNTNLDNRKYVVKNRKRKNNFHTNRCRFGSCGFIGPHWGTVLYAWTTNKQSETIGHQSSFQIIVSLFIWSSYMQFSGRS